MRVTETAYAKINLALHVRKRREDGYHELETVFGFVDAGDVLSAEGCDRDQVLSMGEFASAIDDPLDNLVGKALGKLPRSSGLSVVLEKNLPVAAGLGGGSADAGAVFRIVREMYGLPDDWQARAVSLGADVPACVESRTCIGRGTGTDLEDADNSLAGKPVLLVNPRVPLSTGSVFQKWDGQDRGAMPVGAVSDIALSGRNDLERPAIELCPVIDQILIQLRGTDAFLARMSGSGATCFALYNDFAARDAAADRIAKSQPGWWQMRGSLR